MTNTTTDDVTHLRALLAEQTARAERLEAEAQRALAANAEMRAALVEIIARGQEQRGTGRMIETAEAALSRTDLGAGMVLVERAEFQRVRDELHEWMRGDPDYEEVLADLDALLKKGGAE